MNLCVTLQSAISVHHVNPCVTAWSAVSVHQVNIRGNIEAKQKAPLLAHLNSGSVHTWLSLAPSVIIVNGSIAVCEDLHHRP